MVLAAEYKDEVTVPQGVTASVSGMTVTIKGPKGELKRTFNAPKATIAHAANKITVSCKMPKKQNKADVGTIAGHIGNMIRGVTDGYEYHLKVFYSHFPMNVSVQGDKVMIKNFLGEKYPREAEIIGKTKVAVKGQDVTVTGIDKEDVGQTASNLVMRTKIRRRDPRVFHDGIFLADRGTRK